MRGKNGILTRVLSVVLAIVMVIGTMAISEPSKVEAASNPVAVTINLKSGSDTSFQFSHSTLSNDYQGTENPWKTVAYQFDAYKDGSAESEIVWLDFVGATAYIWGPLHFTDREVPTTSLYIPKGTVMSEITYSGNDEDTPFTSSLVSNGKSLILSNDLKLEKQDGVWVQVEDEPTVPDTPESDVPDSAYDLVKDGVSTYKIVLPANPTEKEGFAANELKHFIQEATGARLKVVKEGAGETPEQYISVGNTVLSQNAGVNPTYEQLGSNGLVIKTINDDCYIKGYGDMGTRNGVYEWLEHTFDYVCYSVDVIKITETKNRKLPDFDLEVVPTFEFREAPGEVAIYDDQRAFRMRFNTADEIFVSGHACHNTFEFIDPEGDYNWKSSTYKSWFSTKTHAHNQRGGKTLPAQLCFSNQAMWPEFLKNLKVRLKDTVQPSMMIGMEDNPLWCTCTTCTASKNKYGADAATIIKFVNYLQEEINKWCDELGRERIQLLMFAYHDAEKPPELVDNSVKLHEDAAVMFAPSRASYAYPFTDYINSHYREEIEGWNKITNNVYVWLYSIYPEDPFVFLDVFPIIKENYQFMKEHGAKSMFDMLASFNENGNSGWERAKLFVMSQLQWDVNQDVDQLLQDFFDNYFEDASDIMMDLMEYNSDYMWNSVLAKYNYQVATDENYTNTRGSCFVQNLVAHSSWFSDDYLLEGMRRADLAFAEIEKYQFTDPERYERLYDHILLERIQFSFIYAYRHTSSKNLGWEYIVQSEEVGIMKMREVWTKQKTMNYFGLSSYNDAEIDFATIMDNGAVCLTATITSGPNAGNTIGGVYGDWKTLRGEITYDIGHQTFKDTAVFSAIDATDTYAGASFYVEGAHFRQNISKITRIAIEEGTVLLTDGAKSVIPVRIANTVQMVKVNDTWLPCNDIDVVYTGMLGGNQMGLNAKIVSGPDAGKTIGEAYGDWVTTATGNITHTSYGNTVEETANWYMYNDNPGDHGANIAMQNATLSSDYGDITNVTIPAGTLLIVPTDAPNSKSALRIVNEINMDKAVNGDWDIECNEIQITLDKIADDNKGIYLNVEIVSGPDIGKHVEDVYGNWPEPSPYGKMTFTRDGFTEERVVAWSTCTMTQKGQIYISGFGSAEGLTEFRFANDTLIVSLNRSNPKPHMRLANNLDYVYEDGEWVNENRINLIYHSFDTTNKGFYLDAEIVSGPDKGKNIAQVYGDWPAAIWADMDYVRNGSAEKMSVVWSPCNTNQIYISGDYRTFVEEITQFTFAENTVLKPVDDRYSTTPIRIVDESQLVPTESGKYIDITMLDIVVQDTYDPDEAGVTNYDMRFISSVNGLNYRSTGFVFSLANENPTMDASNCVYRETNKVYENIRGGINRTRYHVLDLYDGYSKYMNAFEINGVPASKTIYVRAYVQLANGTIMYGNVRAVTAPEAT